MRVFISYGHDFSSEAKMLAESLKSVGYEVWIDCEGIIAGDDWRDSITEAILSSDLVLALLSRYGLRAGGVCLDELAIAMSCNRRNIRPVMMEKGVESLAPASIGGIQFFDLSDWREIPEERFDAWYAEKLDSLQKTCLTRASAYEQKLQSIKSRLHFSPQFSREQFELGKGFQKRHWLDRKIGEWLTGGGGNVCLLIGFPGFGKSCYCANYYHYGDQVTGLVFCDKRKGGAGGIASVIREVSFQLAVMIPSFATRLDRILNDPATQIDARDSEELFELLVLEPFTVIDGNMGKALIILDGVDACSHDGRNELASLFLENAERFPPFLRLLLTTRQDSGVLQGVSDVLRITIDPDDAEVFRDIKCYVTDTVDPLFGDRAKAETVGKTVAERAQGSFLYASAVSDGLRSGKITPDDVGVLPSKVADVYFRWMKQIVPPDEYEEKYADAIALLTALVNPPLEFVRRVMNWRQSALQAFLRKFSVVFVKNIDKCGNTCVSFYCDSFAEWIGDEALAAAYYVSEEDGFCGAADHLADAYEDEEFGDYEYMNAVRILRKAGKKKLLRQMAEDDAFFDGSFRVAEKLQSDPEFFSEWSELLDGLSYLCEKREESDRQRSHVAYLRAKGEFVCGDLMKCSRILDENMSLLSRYENPDDYLNCLYMSGTVCDFKGERDRSVAIFKKLSELSEGQDPKHAIRALAGLVWNDHFNQVDEGLTRLHEMENADLDENMTALKELITARMLSSVGKVDEAITLFGQVLARHAEDLWGYGPAARKNQMLTIEAVVAAYDARDYALARRYGEMIYGKLCGSGSIPECYCLSWLALAYDKCGEMQKASESLAKAKATLGEDGESSSKWLKMHLTSIEAEFLRRAGDTEKCLRFYQEVEKMARECSDVWVRGDACFDILALGFVSGRETDANGEYRTALHALAAQSHLPHLLYKARLVDLLYAGEQEVRGTIEEFTSIPKLASIDEIRIAELLYQKATEIRSGTAGIFKAIMERGSQHEL